MTSPFEQQLLDQLSAQSKITAEQKDMIEQQLGSGNSLAESFAMAGVDELVWLAAWGGLFNMETVDLSERTITQEVLDMIPQELAESYQVLPYAYDSTRKELSVAMADPSNFKAVEALEFLSRKGGWSVSFAVVSPTQFKQIVKQYDSLHAEAEEVLTSIESKYAQQQEQTEQTDQQTLDDMIQSAPVSKMVEVIFKHAVEAKASDIHIEPLDKDSVVRYRVDGQLHISLRYPKHVHASVVSRIKVLANLKIDETRIPQDGRIRITVDSNVIDLRVSTLPLSQTEKVVIRILDTSSASLTFQQLGFTGKNLQFIEENISKSNGMLLVTGPTGSGKSTTLRTALESLNEESVNIITLEDPIEYYIEGVNQSQVRSEIGYTFASGLRSVLRQDPDVVMVGEIRDTETAELAIHAALTGHLVLSTLHTNDALGAIPRFVDMHIEPFLLASTLNIVIAQRLVRKICEHCRQEIDLPDRMQKIVKDALDSMPSEALPTEFVDKKKHVFFNGAGCSRCGDTGYKGRMVVAEVLVMNEELHTLITANKLESLKSVFEKQGTPTMREDGLIKALQGKTTIEEVLTNTK